VGTQASSSESFSGLWNGDEQLRGFSGKSIDSALFWLRAKNSHTPPALLAAVEEVAANPGSKVLKRFRAQGRLLIAQTPIDRRQMPGAILYAQAPTLGADVKPQVNANIWVSRQGFRTPEACSAVGRKILLAALRPVTSIPEARGQFKLPVERSTNLEVLSNVALDMPTTYGELADTAALDAAQELPGDVMDF
jgi:hypothetical protein